LNESFFRDVARSTEPGNDHVYQLSNAQIRKDEKKKLEGEESGPKKRALKRGTTSMREATPGHQALHILIQGFYSGERRTIIWGERRT